MLITIKNLQQESFTVDVDPLQPVRQIKEKIEQLKGKDYPSKHQKLMYAGKILADANTLTDYGIDEKKYLIILVKRPKPTVVNDDEEMESSEGRSVEDVFSGVERNALGLRGSEINFVSEERHQLLVSQIMEMGYQRPDVERALRASFHNAERAVEYLLTGIIPGSSGEQQRQPVASTSSTTEEGTSSSSPSAANTVATTTPTAAAESDAPMPVAAPEFLHTMNADEFQTLHNAIQQNADRVIEFPEFRVRQSANRFPERQVLSPSHQEAVFHMLNPQPSDTDENNQPSGSLLTRNRTQQDQDAIDRLKQLGFPEYQAIEAYFACERNENSAADFLFSQNYD